MKIVTIVQARTESTRLFQKTLLPVLGKPILFRMLERVMLSKLVGEVVVATTINKSDDIIYNQCLSEGYECFRGNPLDLLDRHYNCALAYNADVVLKIPSDCPLIDPNIIDVVISKFLDGNYDYCSNLHPATYPDGMDVEVFSFETLKTAWKYAKKNFEREHTTPYIWERNKKFKLGNYEWENGLNYSMTHRLTIDYYEDYLLINNIFENLYKKNKVFKLEDTLLYLKENPDLSKINSKFNGVNWYRHHIEELKTIDQSKTKNCDE